MHAPPVYLDYNATTPIDPAVLEAMLPYLRERFGNASSAHYYGYLARDAMAQARARTAALIGAHPDEIVFTGGGSESDNLAIQGVVSRAHTASPHVITTAVEHPAVLTTVQYLRQRFGVEATVLPVDGYGLVDPDAVRRALRPSTVLVSVMHANNEVGTIQPLAEIGRITREASILFHSDAAQSVGKIPVDVNALGVDLLTIAGHKLYAPKGIGALYVRRDTALDPVIHGSGQEHGLRAGTENVASMIALGMASALAATDLEAFPGRLSVLRDRLFDGLAERIPGIELNGHPTARLPNTLNVSLPGVLGQAVLAAATSVAASTGSACHSGITEPSPVLTALGIPVERALGALRLSLGRWSTDDEVDRASESLAAAYRATRSAVPAG